MYKLSALILAMASVHISAIGVRAQNQEQVWEYFPYRVLVWLVFDDAPELTPALRQRISRRIKERADTIARSAWLNTDVLPPPAKLRTDLLHRLDDIGAMRIEDHLTGIGDQGEIERERKRKEIARKKAEANTKTKATGDSAAGDSAAAKAKTVPKTEKKTDDQSKRQPVEHDKLLVISVLRGSHAFEIRVRDFDLTSLAGGQVFSQSERHIDRLPELCVQRMFDAFSPLTRIEKTRGRSAEMRIRANGLILARRAASGHDDDQRNPALLKKGDVLIPAIRFNGRRGGTLGAMSPPWTYLVIREKRKFRATGQIISGVSRPLGRRSTRTTQMFGLGVRTPGDATQLMIRHKPRQAAGGMEGSPPPQPIAGYEVAARLIGDKMPQRRQQGEIVKDPPEEVVGVSDWRGAVQVNRGGDSPLRELYIRSGGILLARLPLVPGLYNTITAEVRSDEARLRAEGVNRSIQTDLLDVLAKRKVLIVMIRKRLEEREIDEAQKLLVELQALQKKDDFQDLLLRQQRSLRRERSDQVSPRMEAKIQRQFDASEKLVNQFLTPGEIEEIKNELQSAQPTSGG